MNFRLLNAVQFLDALNENLFKYIVVYFLIFYQGHENTSSIMAITGTIFILPFILFSSLGGIFADRWSKTKIIQITRVIQIGWMGLACLCIFFEQGMLIYAALFIIASLSAIFGPSKYGIISEIVPESQFLKANGQIAAFTFFGIILGTSLASLLDTITHQTFPLMVLVSLIISIVGAILSYRMQPTVAIDPQKPWPWFIYKEIYDSLTQMKKIPLMLTAAFSYGYFLFIGAFVQMNIIPYSISTLGKAPAVGGYLFLFSAIGVGIGSLIATKTSGKLSTLPWSGLGMSIGGFLFTFCPSPFWVNIVWLIGLGVCGGLFLVPPQAFILANSPAKHKGMNFGTANFLSFAFALLAAGVLSLFNTALGMTPSMSFAWIGILNIGVCLILFSLTRKSNSL